MNHSAKDNAVKTATQSLAESHPAPPTAGSTDVLTKAAVTTSPLPNPNVGSNKVVSRDKRISDLQHRIDKLFEDGNSNKVNLQCFEMFKGFISKVINL